MRPLYDKLLDQAAGPRQVEALAGLERGRPPVDDQEARLAGVLSALSRTADAVKDGAAVDPEFRDRLRRRLTAVATVQVHALPVPTPAVLSERAPARMARPAVALAGLAAAVVTVGGVAIGTSRSLPGEPLYALKRGTESLQAITAGNSVEQGQRHLKLAEVRLEEVKALAKQGQGSAIGPLGDGRTLAAGSADSGDLVTTLAAMDAETREGKRLLIDAATQSHDDAPVRLLQQWSDEQTSRIAQVLDDLPGPAKERAQTSLRLVLAVGTAAQQALTTITCSTNCPAPTPTGSPLAASPTATLPPTAALQPTATVPPTALSAPAATSAPTDTLPPATDPPAPATTAPTDIPTEPLPVATDPLPPPTLPVVPLPTLDPTTTPPVDPTTTPPVSPTPPLPLPTGTPTLNPTPTVDPTTPTPQTGSGGATASATTGSVGDGSGAPSDTPDPTVSPAANR